MPVAAVPKYLPENQFAQASPVLRFGLLLSIWTDRKDQENEVRDRANKGSREAERLRQELGPNNQRMGQVIDRMVRNQDLPGLWEKNDHAGREAWQKVAALSAQDKQLMQAIAARQKRLAAMQAKETVWQCEAEATAPFTTGLGNEHPLENGFSFLNPYGLPYLPGSGVKGAVREAARQLAEGLWEDSRGWDRESVGAFTVKEGGQERKIELTALEVLFGRETPEGESDHFRGVLTFWDVVPQIVGDKLRVEVMTPHQSHYYQQQSKRESGLSTAPHDSGQPNPILFLTVPPGSKFAFTVTCDLRRLKQCAPQLEESARWRQLLEAAFSHAFEWLGFGAKTAVGYGAMKRVETRPAASTLGGEAAARAGAPESKAALPVFAANEEVWENAMLKWNPGKQELMATLGNQKALVTGKAAQQFLDALPEDARNTLLKDKKSLAGVRLRVRVEGNKITLAGLA